MHTKSLAMISGLMLMVLLLSSCEIVDSSALSSGPQVRMGATNFIDSTVTVHQGESVVLVDTVTSTHIITNGTWDGGTPKAKAEVGAPKVNVTVSNAGQQQLIGPFTSPGNFQMFCTIHQSMNLAIFVK